MDGVPVPRAADPVAGAAAADLAILPQHHGSYDLPALAAGARLLLDTRGRAPRREGVDVL